MWIAKILYQFLTKTFSYRNSKLEKPKVLLLASTVVTAINIEGKTIHSALHIPIGNFKNHFPALKVH